MRLASVLKFLPFLVLGIAPAVSAGDPLLPSDIVRVEEDWELRVVHPDGLIDAPQVTTSLLPFGESSDILFQFDINHASLPTFESKGVQIRISDDDVLISQARLLGDKQLSKNGEVLSWTQVAQRTASGLVFGVTNAVSHSLGDFGGTASYTYASEFAMGDSDLDDYSIADSLANSGVTFSGNRVDYLRLKTVRLYRADGWFWNIDVNQDVQ